MKYREQTQHYYYHVKLNVYTPLHKCQLTLLTITPIDWLLLSSLLGHISVNDKQEQLLVNSL